MKHALALATIALLVGSSAVALARPVTVAAVQLTPVNASTPAATLHKAANQVVFVVASLVVNASLPGDLTIVRSAEASAAVAPPDLVVFPEYGILGSYAPENSLCGSNFTFADACVDVPVTGSELKCPSSGRTEGLGPLETIACQSDWFNYPNISISVNLCERCDSRDGRGKCNTTAARTGGGDASVKYFNTQVVLRGKRIVAQYRKFHPWATTCYDTPSLELVTFTPVDTSSRFGLFTCFDIVFPEPSGGLIAEGVRHFSYSSAIPLVGKLTVAAFSLLKNVTMINSNLQSGQTAIAVRGDDVASCADAVGLCAAVHVIDV